ncbi:hypothetical protein NFI96_032241 [Prochilodus magdalenae]|nr:hypothetical protein NFI96_032241 [Prochilodus magdalenae]
MKAGNVTADGALLNARLKILRINMHALYVVALSPVQSEQLPWTRSCITLSRRSSGIAEEHAKVSQCTFCTED